MKKYLSKYKRHLRQPDYSVVKFYNTSFDLDNEVIDFSKYQFV